MWPGGIQDESSKHEHQEVPTLLRYLSQTEDVVYSMFRLSQRRTPRQLSQSYNAVRIRRNRARPLMTVRRRLSKVLRIIYSHTKLMGRVLLVAEKSQLINPAFVNIVAAVKRDLEVAAAAPTMHKASDDVQTALLKRAIAQLVNARRMFAYLCQVLDLERAEL